MQNNWYAVYTKPHCEGKVSLLLTKKRIENFCPLNYKKSQSLLRRKILHEPLFKSYVFVKTKDSDIITLSKQVKGIVSVLYWKGKPATINEEEVNAIKEFTNNHHEIELEKCDVNLSSSEDIMESKTYAMDGKILVIKNRAMKVYLPSLGFTMIAKIEDESILGRKISFGKKEFLVQS